MRKGRKKRVNLNSNDLRSQRVVINVLLSNSKQTRPSKLQFFTDPQLCQWIEIECETKACLLELNVKLPQTPKLVTNVLLFNFNFK